MHGKSCYLPVQPSSELIFLRTYRDHIFTEIYYLTVIFVGTKMSDIDQIPRLISLASNTNQLQNAQHTAAQKLLDFDGEVYPSDGCAITLSTLLQEAGIVVDDTYQALALGNVLSARHWQRIPVGEQQNGDVGSTCGPTPNHGRDHIYLVLKVLNTDEMVIADNQQPQPHFRFASGQGRTPTKFFLRATLDTAERID